MILNYCVFQALPLTNSTKSLHSLLDLGLTRDLLWVCFEGLNDVLLAQENSGALRLRVASKGKCCHARQLLHSIHGVGNHWRRVKVCPLQNVAQDK